MRHRTLLTSLLLAALLLGGWGGVVAAVFCAHDGGTRAEMTEEHDCCRAQLEQQHKEHCEAASKAPHSHEAMTMGEMETTAAATTATEPEAGAVVVLNQFDAACLHCVNRRDVPATFVIARQPEQKKRAVSFAAPPQLLLLAAPVVSFAPTLNAKQNAPPGVAARRHLLIGIFII